VDGSDVSDICENFDRGEQKGLVWMRICACVTSTCITLRRSKSRF